ncbi:hypothetical protein NIES4071_104090 (plasmid) [Calothrix sp. NIES-4071]|nr:hypothetical protein NIES4071_104090 [Calothrix sp. NIES-4071]BAZ64396.1 hypothetical protein NIES4105_101290 [Calothrix sp. NIES-4105]
MEFISTDPSGTLGEKSELKIWNKTVYYVNKDESVQVYICVKLPSAELANPTVDTQA